MTAAIRRWALGTDSLSSRETIAGSTIAFSSNLATDHPRLIRSRLTAFLRALGPGSGLGRLNRSTQQCLESIGGSVEAEGLAGSCIQLRRDGVEVVRPGRWPVSRSAWRIHLRNASPEQPIFWAIEAIAPHWEGYSWVWLGLPRFSGHRG